MENRDIDNYSSYDYENHPNIKGVQVINGVNNFPISWLNIQGYCEYELYLQYFKGVVAPPTMAMRTGTKVHNQLEQEFKKTAKPASFKQTIETSKTIETKTREMFIIEPEYGIRGFIDEVQMTPNEFIIIDDKPGTRAYPSQINQVRAYCLAFKSLVEREDENNTRKIIGALRQRGTDNVFYTEEFDEDVEKEIIYLIDRMQGLFYGTKPFVPTKNPNKCKSCRFNDVCEYNQS
ncbi:MAG: CRISPR-associated protein Cas4 [Methanobrevibacter boviskoreani]|jgi:CRISPR-associated exonuclease Cas4|uniref:CRISPR-associated protein Cas4 n=1 Tax=Methanobrevibacter boviskoreani TaxID=1348249 RepID=UPI003D8DA9C2